MSFRKTKIADQTERDFMLSELETIKKDIQQNVLDERLGDIGMQR